MLLIYLRHLGINISTQNTLREINLQNNEFYPMNLGILSGEFLPKCYTDISCLGGVFAKNTSRETKNIRSRMVREI